MILYYKSFNIPKRLCLFTTLSLYPEPNPFNISSLVFSKSLLTPTGLFLAFSSLSILFHGVKPVLDTIPAERQRANRKELRISYGLHARLPLTLKSGLFPIFSPICITVLTHIQLVISQHHMLSQYCYLLRYPSSVYIYLFSLPHFRPFYLYLLNFHLTHSNHFCILSRSHWTLNLPSTICKASWSL